MISGRRRRCAITLPAAPAIGVVSDRASGIGVRTKTWFGVIDPSLYRVVEMAAFWARTVDDTYGSRRSDTPGVRAHEVRGQFRTDHCNEAI